MNIYVDADACPVVSIVEEISKKYNISVTLLCDTNHVLHSEYSEVVMVGAGADAVDYKLISLCHRGDVAGLWCCGDGAWKRGVCHSSVGAVVYG